LSAPAHAWSRSSWTVRRPAFSPSSHCLSHSQTDSSLFSIAEHGLLPLDSLLSHPHASHLLGRSLMIEGGARIIASCLAAPPPGLVDLVIVTVAPVFVGEGGVGAIAPGRKGEGRPPRLEHVRTEVFGQDSVVVARPVYDEGLERDGEAA